MFILSFLRTIKFSFQDIFRNIWLSLASIIILMLALFSVNILLAVNFISKTAVSALKEKIDINLYLNPEAKEEEILALKAKISGLEQVKNVSYVSQSEALENFRLKHQDNPKILEALEELGKNPLAPSLIVQPREDGLYDDLAKNLDGLEDKIIMSRDFANPKAALDKINQITDRAKDVGLVMSIVFIFITTSVVYYSIRIAIYAHRREIAIMKLVGADNWFIRAPFFISSLFYTFSGVILTALLFYPFLTFLQPYLNAFFSGFNISIVSYFFSENLFKIFGLEFLGIALINILASLIAVGKYSKV